MAVLTFQGREEFGIAPAELFPLLADLDRLATFMPDLTASERVVSDAAKWTVRPGFSFLRGTLHIDVQRTSCEPDAILELAVAAVGIGSRIEMAGRVDVQPDSLGATAHWQIEVQKLTGLVAPVPKTLIRAAAEDTIRKTWAKIHAHCENLAKNSGNPGKPG